MQFQASDVTLSRRDLLKLGTGATLALGTVSLAAGLTGCGQRQQASAQGFNVLRDADVVLFTALTPVIVPGIVKQAQPAEVQHKVLLGIDSALIGLGGHGQGEAFKLFDLLHLRVTRWLTTGVSAPWNEATSADIEQFLLRWRDSGVATFNIGYRVLSKLVSLNYYSQPEAWVEAGYPGPLDWVYKAVNA